MPARDFTAVTELPGIRVTLEQFSMLHARYHHAAGYFAGKEVLEVACPGGPRWADIQAASRCPRRRQVVCQQ